MKEKMTPLKFSTFKVFFMLRALICFKAYAVEELFKDSHNPALLPLARTVLRSGKITEAAIDPARSEQDAEIKEAYALANKTVGGFLRARLS